MFGKFDPQKIALPERLPRFDMKCVLDERGGREGESASHRRLCACQHIRLAV
jgi:hypothetical protein